MVTWQFIFLPMCLDDEVIICIIIFRRLIDTLDTPITPTYINTLAERQNILILHYIFM